MSELIQRGIIKHYNGSDHNTEISYLIANNKLTLSFQFRNTQYSLKRFGLIQYELEELSK